MACSKMFNLKSLIFLSLMLTALFVGGNAGGSGSGSKEDGHSTSHQCNKIEHGSGAGKDCERHNKTQCLVASSKGSKEAEGCPVDESGSSSTQQPQTTTGAVQNSTQLMEESTCQFIEALENCTFSNLFSPSQQTVLESLVIEVNIILTGSECEKAGWDKPKEHRCKLKKILKSLKQFESDHEDIWAIFIWMEIQDYGNFLQTVYDIKTLCSQDASAEISNSGSSNCSLCAALQNYTDQQPAGTYKNDTAKLVLQLEIVFSYQEWDNSQRKGWAFGHIKDHKEKYPSKEQEFNDIEFGDNGDDVESFGEGAEVYEKVENLPDILSGSVSSCPLLQAMRNYSANTSNDLDNRSQMQQLSVKLSAFFANYSSVSDRLDYCAYQIHQCLLQVPKLTQDLLLLVVVGFDGQEWGNVFEITYCSSLCSNFGCGNKTAGPGKFPSKSDRHRLITPDSKNETYFFKACQSYYNTLTVIQKAQFKTSVMNAVAKFIYSPLQCTSDPAPGSNCRLAGVISVVLSSTFKVSFGVTQIETYYGEETCSDSGLATVSQFCSA